MDQRRSRPQDRKERILAAAANLFAARGYAAVGIDDIADAVGITGSAIYRHYPGKQALLSAVILHAVEDLADQTDAGRAAGAPLAHLTAAAVAFALDHPALLATYLRERDRLAEEDHARVVAAEDRLSSTLSAAVRAELPHLDDRRVRVRQHGVLSAITGASRRPTDGDRNRVKPLLAASAL